MSMSFIGPSGSFERRWIVYAMLRDNVQHHLEGGTPTEEFGALHRLGDAMWTGKVSVPALALRAELSKAAELLARPIADLAVSIRTRAVCTYTLNRPDERGTVLARLMEWEVPYPLLDAATLDDAFGSLHAELMRITEGATPTDVVEVLDS